LVVPGQNGLQVAFEMSDNLTLVRGAISRCGMARRLIHVSGSAMRRFVRQPVFYPVSTVFVDDHPGFLDALEPIGTGL
jgi:hypothetical protein